ncbi:MULTISPECIES: hypothetical protein [unclassified Streptomyces]|nr:MULTISPECIES: hypothetical protein [unclassified Streptomyces]
MADDITHQDRMFLASEDVYRRMHTGECTDATAELMQAALDVSDQD